MRQPVLQAHMQHSNARRETKAHTSTQVIVIVQSAGQSYISDSSFFETALVPVSREEAARQLPTMGSCFAQLMQTVRPASQTQVGAVCGFSAPNNPALHDIDPAPFPPPPPFILVPLEIPDRAALELHRSKDQTPHSPE